MLVIINHDNAHTMNVICAHPHIWGKIWSVELSITLGWHLPANCRLSGLEWL